MDDYNVYAAMQEGEPLARFQKTILGKVHVLALDPFEEKPIAVILKGAPGQKESFIEIFSVKALAFFERMNEKHFQRGRLVRTDKAPEVPISPNQLSDAEIDVLLDPKQTPFFKLQSELNKFTDTAPVFRILNRARELDVSSNLMKHIEGRMSELELEKFEGKQE